MWSRVCEAIECYVWVEGRERQYLCVCVCLNQGGGCEEAENLCVTQQSRWYMVEAELRQKGNYCVHKAGKRLCMRQRKSQIEELPLIHSLTPQHFCAELCITVAGLQDKSLSVLSHSHICSRKLTTYCSIITCTSFMSGRYVSVWMIMFYLSKRIGKIWIDSCLVWRWIDMSVVRDVLEGQNARHEWEMN